MAVAVGVAIYVAVGVAVAVAVTTAVSVAVPVAVVFLVLVLLSAHFKKFSTVPYTEFFTLCLTCAKKHKIINNGVQTKQYFFLMYFLV